MQSPFFSISQLHYRTLKGQRLVQDCLQRICRTTGSLVWSKEVEKSNFRQYPKLQSVCVCVSNPVSKGCTIYMSIPFDDCRPSVFKLVFDFEFRIPFMLNSRGVQSTVETAPNEAIHLCWKHGLINRVYLLHQVELLHKLLSYCVFRHQSQ